MSSEELNAAGAGAGAPSPPVERPHFKQPPLFRTESYLGTELGKFHYNKEHPETYAVNYPEIRERFPHGIHRSFYEQHEAPLQCDVILGPANQEGRVCWLCGFPILGITSLQDEGGNPVFFQKTPGLDKGSCDHVLPVKLAHAVLKILHLEKLENLSDPIANKLLHTEYEYSHFFCNAYKSNEYFVTLPLGSRDLCSLEVKEEIIDGILKRIFFTRRGDPKYKVNAPNSSAPKKKRKSQDSLVTTEYDGNTYEFRNIVQAYCFTNDPEAFLKSDYKVYRAWAAKVKPLIIEKMKRVIQYIKEADGCGTNAPGKVLSGFTERLLTGTNEIKTYGLKDPKVTSLKGPQAKFMRRFQRMPSFENILATTKFRPLPAFTAPPYNRYKMVRPLSPVSRTSPKTTSSNSSEESVVVRKPRASRKKVEVINVVPVGNNVENILAIAPVARKPRASRKKAVVAPVAENIEDVAAPVEERRVNSPRAVLAENALEAVNALAAAGAGAPAEAVEEARGDYVEAVAQELHQDAVASRTRGALSRTRGRRITNYFSSAPRRKGFFPKGMSRKAKKNSNSNYKPNE